MEPKASPVSTEHVETRLYDDVLLPVLKVDRVLLEDADSLGELGCSSIEYVQIAKRISTEFSVRFTPVDLLAHSGMADLVERLVTVIEEQGQGESAAAPRSGGKGPSAPARGRHDRAEPRVQPSDPEAVADDPVAIVGMACRLPGGITSPTNLWENLIAGRNEIQDIATARPSLLQDHQEYGGPVHGMPQFAGFVEGTEFFDAAFFGISPLEARAMDPQQRKMMELTWHLLESSGIRPEEAAAVRTSVHIGAHNVDYADLVQRHPDLFGTFGAQLDSGLHLSMLANRISRHFNFRGVSEVINTACSSSLVAVDRAVREIRDGRSDLAVAAGVNLLFSARQFYCNNQSGMQSPTGQCQAFSAGADGYVRAEGYGAVLLKPLSAAVRDGDHVHALIVASGVNHDGASDFLRAPNQEAQRDLIVDTYRRHHIDPGSVGYIEAHGTGTELGDPIEVRGLVDAFRTLGVPAGTQCLIGSVKTAVGHTESSAGIAGLISAVLSVLHSRVPGNQHLDEPNPHLDLDGSPIIPVGKDHRPWPGRGSAPRRAGVSSFGFGGSNAHVVVQEAPARTRCQTTRSAFPVLLSGKDLSAVRRLAESLAEWLEGHPDAGLDIISAQLADRPSLPVRRAFIATDVPSARDALRSISGGDQPATRLWEGTADRRRPTESTDLDLTDEKSLADVLASWVRGGTVRRLAPLTGFTSYDLPLYPFAQVRHWFDQAHQDPKPAPNPDAGRLHSLVHFDVSSAREPRYRTVLELGPEHQTVSSVFSRAEQLTACRVAVSLAGGRDGTDEALVPVSDIRWGADPAVVSRRQLNVDICVERVDDRLLFDCFVPAEDSGADTVLMQGWAAASG